MTRFIYITDTHFGANPMEYQQQKGYPEKLRDIVALLDAWIRKNGDIEFVLHGGDMIDSATKDAICGARRLFDLSVPVYLCLGNHDLTDPGALDMWMTLAPEFFPNGAPNFSIRGGDCFIHVTPNQWCRTPYCWKREEEEPHFLSGQTGGLEASLAKHPDAIHIFSTHGPVWGVPSEQTGFEDPYHSPAESFSRVVFDLVRRHPQIRCVLSGHNHINTHVEQDGVHFVTASGLVETPFEFKVIEAGPEMLKMFTVSLVRQVDVEAEYDYNKTYVQGREKDRAFQERL